MKTRLFPTHFNIILDEAERGALENLFDLNPYLEDIELIHKALREGIKALNQAGEARRKNPDLPTRTQIETAKSASPTLVENYIGFPIEERLRQRLEDFLADCPGVLSDEDAFAMLIDLGLKHADGRSVVEVVERAKRAARSRRKFARLGLHLVGR